MVFSTGEKKPRLIHRWMLTETPVNRRFYCKVKFSRNWLKAKQKLQKLHRHITNIWDNFLHHTFSQISKNHAIVCIEDLQGNTFGLNLVWTNLSSIKAGVSFGGSWTTNWRGSAVISFPYHYKILAVFAQVAAMSRLKTAKHKRSFNVCNAAMKNTPMLSIRSMFWNNDSGATQCRTWAP